MVGFTFRERLYMTQPFWPFLFHVFYSWYFRYNETWKKKSILKRRATSYKIYFSAVSHQLQCFKYCTRNGCIQVLNCALRLTLLMNDLAQNLRLEMNRTGNIIRQKQCHPLYVQWVSWESESCHKTLLFTENTWTVRRLMKNVAINNLKAASPTQAAF